MDKYEHDRGAVSQLTFNRCLRGFTLMAYDLGRDARAVYAFDHIEDLAAWLVEQYAAIADTHPKDGDVKQAPLVSGGGAEGNRPDTVTNARDGTE